MQKGKACMDMSKISTIFWENGSCHTEYRSCVRAQSYQNKDCKIGICCFSAKHYTLRSKSKGWLARYQDSVLAQKNRTKRVGLEKVDIIMM